MPSFSEKKSQEFFDAARDGNLPLVKSLSVDPQVNVNLQGGDGFTAFFYACRYVHVDVVRYLLDFHDNQRPIDYNLANQSGATPFSVACLNGYEKVVEMLLEDDRIDVNRANRLEHTPLWYASFSGHVGVVKRMFASTRQIDVLKKDQWGKIAAEIARERGKNDVAALIVSYQRDPQGVRKQLRRELGYPEVSSSIPKPFSTNFAPENKRKQEATPAFHVPQSSSLSTSKEHKIFTQPPQAHSSLPPKPSTPSKEQEEIESLKKQLQDLKKEMEKQKEISSRASASGSGSCSTIPSGQDNRRVAVDYNGGKHAIKVPLSSMEELVTSLKEQLEIASTEVSLEYYDTEFDDFLILKKIEDLPAERIRIKVAVAQAKSWWRWSPNPNWIEKGYEATRYSSLLVKEGSKIHQPDAMTKFSWAADRLGFEADRIQKIFAISNTKLLSNFENHRDFLQGKHRASPNLFKKDDWKDLPNMGRRQLQLDLLFKDIGKWDWNERTKPPVLLMLHGASEEGVWQICQQGFGTVAAIDAGFYGRGVYFTSNLSYADYYAKKSDQGGNDLGKPFLLSAVIPGNVFPVIEDPYLSAKTTDPEEALETNPEGFLGKAFRPGYQSHHVLVNEESPNMGLPTRDLQTTKFVDELVTFEAAQALPLFVFYMK